MAIENIEKKVLESARAEAEQIVRQAEEQAAERLATATTANQDRARQAIEEAREALQQTLDQQTTSARAANKLKLLTGKADLLGDILDAAVDQFIGDRGGDYRRWLAAQLDKVAGEAGALVCAPDDRAAVDELLAGLKQSGGAAGLSLADETRPLHGGFLLQGEKLDADLSLDTQLAELKTDLLPDLAARAFEENVSNRGPGTE